MLTTLVCLTLYAVTIWYVDNLEQPEVWLLALVPFWLLFVRLVHVESRLGAGIIFVCVLPAALLLHNGIGGMAMLNHPEWRVFVTGEVVQPPEFVRRAPEAWMSDSVGVVARFRNSKRRVHHDDWGGAYLLEARDALTGEKKE